MTIRAIEVLKSVDLIFAEDTRTTGKLLKHFEIETPMQPYHMHNEHKIAERIAERITERLSESGDVALVSDAGTPAISDPGFLLVRACIEKGIEVECLPGATAFVPALVISGLPADRFVFEGFLPHKKGRQKRLLALVEEVRTIIFYESPYRLRKSLTQMAEHFGQDRQVVVVRELSKIYESAYRGTFQQLLEQIDAGELKEKGEIVIVVAGIAKKAS
jgi:16S rRNA (cytidine1402-2'-O)-methyltransferase